MSSFSSCFRQIMTPVFVMRAVLLILFALVVRELIVQPDPWDLEHVPRLLAGDNTPALIDLIQFTQWYAWFAVAAGLLLLVVTARGWMSTESVPDVWSHRRHPRWFVAGLVVLVLVAGGFRSVRLPQSFHGDEVWGFGDYAFGRFKVAEDQSLSFKRYNWERTLYNNRESNNHILQNVFSRLTLSWYQKRMGYSRDHLSESAVRFPSLIAGMLSLVFLGLAVANYAGPHAGLLASALLAVHPVHFRYSAEARGYSLMFFFASLALWAVGRALNHGRWRDWAIFALALGGMCYSWLGSLHAAGCLGLAALFAIYRTRNTSPHVMKIQYSRLLVCVCATGMMLAPLLAPSLPQVKRYLTFSTRMHGTNDLRRFESAVLLNFTGTHLSVRNKYAGKELDFSSYSPWRKCLVLAVLTTMVAAVATAAFVLLRERGSPLLVVFAALPLSLVPSWIQTSLSGNDLKPQYVLP